MRLKNVAVLLAVVSLMIFSRGQVPAQSVPAIMEVPESLPAPQREGLTAQKVRLVNERKEIREKAAAHNRQCTGVEENSPLAATCADEQAVLQDRIKTYSEEVKKYNERIKTALAEASRGVAESSSPLVRKEQQEFDQMRSEWLRKQQELIKQKADGDKEWTNEVLASITELRVPSPVFRPKALDDLRPGDVLLVAPDDSLLASGITVVDPFYRALDYFSAGDVSAPDLKQGRVSHALTFVRTVNGEMLFLDHTKEGSRILSKDAYIRKYGQRAMYIARPQAKVDGGKLWEVAREAAMQKKSDYGLIGKNVVCSEKAAIAVAIATGVPVDKERHRLRTYPGLTILGPVDITPNDFFDDKHAGKYFVVSASPIFPAKR